MDLQRLDDPRQQMSTASRLEASRLGSLAAVLGQAFHNEPNLVYMFPDEDARRIVSPSFFQSVIHAGLLFGEILTTENPDGVAVWICPDHDLPLRQMLRRELMEFPFDLEWNSATRCMKLGASIEEVRRRLAPNPHWYLLALGMERPTQEKTIGDALIEPVLSRADSSGVPCYLETFSDKRLPFYMDFGFRIIGAGRIPDGGPNFWAMTRFPK